MLYNPKKFNCNHQKLIKNELNIYSCIKCNKNFVIIPAKNEPINPIFKKPYRPFPDRKFKYNF